MLEVKRKDMIEKLGWHSHPDESFISRTDPLLAGEDTNNHHLTPTALAPEGAVPLTQRAEGDAAIPTDEDEA